MRSDPPRAAPAMSRSFVAAAAIMSPVLMFAGCGPGGPVCHPVSGQVFWKDQPLAEAMVVFHPLSETKDAAPKPLAYTDAEGRFALTTLAPGDGAPAGEYAVTVELRAERQVGEEVVRDGPNLLPTEYANPSQTPTRYTVTAGKNEVPAIRIGS